MFAVTVRGNPAFDHARQAQAMLDASTWSRLVEIRNTNSRSHYPSTVYALVFEAAGILWFYTDTDGTQSFSRFTNRLDEEKRDFTAGLRAIDAGFTSFRLVEPRGPAPVLSHQLPNGCFIESLSAAQSLPFGARGLTDARLVSVYVGERHHRRGHTVLVFEDHRGAYVVDRTISPVPRRIGEKLPREPLAVARQILGNVVTLSARYVPLPLVETPAAALVTTLDRDGKTSAVLAENPRDTRQL